MLGNFAWIRAKYVLVLVFNSTLFYALWKWFVDNVPFDVLVADIRHIHPSSLFLTVVLGFIASLCYGYRLKKLLDCSFSQAWSLVCVGNGLNNLLPFRLGDAMRIYLAKERFRMDVHQLVAATIVERYCDLVLLLGFGAVFCVFGRLSFDGMLSMVMLLLLCCGSLSLVIYRALMTPGVKLKAWLQRFSHVQLVVNSLSQMTHVRQLHKILWCSFLVWFSTVAIYYAFFSQNLSVGLNYPEAILLCLSTTLAFAVPYMIAGIGVFESALFYVLVQYVHVGSAEAIALALVFHLAFALPQILWMVIALTWPRVRWVAPLLLSRRFS